MMAYGDFQEFLAALDGEGELQRITAEVDPAGELAEITDRISKSPVPPALLFEKVRGSRFPVATNVFGSFRRTALALGVPSFPEIAPLMNRLLTRVGSPADEDEAWGRLAKTFAELRPKLVADAPCREVTEERPSLEGLPFIGNFAGDGGGRGGYFTLPLVFTRDPVDGMQNCGIYRIQLLGSNSLGIGWHGGSGGRRHWLKECDAAERMPVAIVLGSDPSVIFAAGFSFPAGADELHYAGILRGAPVEVVRCITSDIEVPAGAELVIEGYLEPGEGGLEGPYGNHTGFYAPQRRVPVMRVTCITRRRSPVIPATVVGKPPAEDCYLAKGAERLLLPMLRLRFPEISELNFPMEGIFHRAALISVRPGSDSVTLLKRLREAGPLRDSPLLAVVDDDVSVADPSEVFRRLLNVARFSTSVSVRGEKIDIDGTRRKGADSPAPVQRDRRWMSLVDSRWSEYFGEAAAGFPPTAERKG
jgi:4-hydroxy-3-polyprenylbenzoate decarboxylase